MTNFDLEMLKQNIKQLLKNKGMTQQQLAEVLGMSQSNVSKALNEDEKKCFTVEQIYTIAENFQVSIDSLFGRDTNRRAKAGQREIASFLAALLSDETAKSKDIKITEDVYEVDFSSGMFDTKHEKRDIPYKAVYFPDYWNPGESAKNDEEYQELYSVASQCGNETRNIKLNIFLRKFTDILRVYQEGQISREAFEIVLKDYLGQLPET